MALLLFVFALAVLAGCEYYFSEPLAENLAVPLDQSMLGLWQFVPAKTGDPVSYLMIVAFSGSEYLFHLFSPGSDEHLYYRGYPVRIGGDTCVQLRELGENSLKKGWKAADEKKSYLVVLATLKDANLEFGLLQVPRGEKKIEGRAFLREVRRSGDIKPYLTYEYGLKYKRAAALPGKTGNPK
jgi:hypothetical protein